MSKDPRIGSFPIKSFKPQPGGLLSLTSLIGPQDPSMPPPSSVQGFLPDYSKLSPEQEKVANAVAWGIRNTIKGDSPYKLSKIAQAEGLAPNLTCIGGACNLYKNLGLDFSVFGKEPGVHLQKIMLKQVLSNFKIKRLIMMSFRKCLKLG